MFLRKLYDSNFFGATTEFVDCVFSGKIEKAVFYGSVPKEERAQLGRITNKFRGNDSREAELVDVAFRGGIDLTRQLLPAGENYLYLPDAASAVAIVRKEVVTWRDLDARREAIAIIKELEFDIEGGQAELLLNLHDPVSRGQRDAADRFYERLRQAARKIRVDD